MITLDQYFGPWRNHPDATKARRENAQRLLVSVEKLAALAVADGVVFRANPKTGSVDAAAADDGPAASGSGLRTESPGDLAERCAVTTAVAVGWVEWWRGVEGSTQ